MWSYVSFIMCAFCCLTYSILYYTYTIIHTYTPGKIKTHCSESQDLSHCSWSPAKSGHEWQSFCHEWMVPRPFMAATVGPPLPPVVPRIFNPPQLLK